MENRSYALIAGFFTIALIALTVVFAYWLGRDNIQRKPFEIVTRLSVAGLNPQAAVRYKGIKVGNVTDIDFDPKSPGEIIIQIDILPDTPITQSTFARLGSQGVTGIAYIELDDDGSKPTPLTTSASNVAHLPLRPGLLQTIEQRGLAILDQTEEISKRLNILLDPKNPKSVHTAIDNISKAAVAWQGVPEKLEPALAHIPELVETSRNSMAAFKTFSNDASTLSKNWSALAANLQSPNGALARLNNSVDQISDALTLQTVPNINALSNDARSTLRSINRTSDALKDRPQSILFGQPAPPPGPGESGFVAPAAHP